MKKKMKKLYSVGTNKVRIIRIIIQLFHQMWSVRTAKVALNARGMTVEAAHQCAWGRVEWTAGVKE